MEINTYYSIASNKTVIDLTSATKFLAFVVKDDCEEDCLVPYRGREGILTYCNSD